MPKRKADLSPEPQMSMSQQADPSMPDRRERPATRSRTAQPTKAQAATAATSSKRPATTKRKKTSASQVFTQSEAPSVPAMPTAGPSEATTSPSLAVLDDATRTRRTRTAQAATVPSQSETPSVPAMPMAGPSETTTSLGSEVLDNATRSRTAQATTVPSQSETLSVPAMPEAGPSHTTSEVLDEINKLFSWNPPLFLLDSKKKKSVASRRPAFYDQHFSHNLVLKKVVRLASLVKDFANVATSALNEASESLPPLSGFITAQQRRDDEMKLSSLLIDESAVASYYKETTSKYCTCVASNLTLVPIPRWYTLLSWTQSPSYSDYAVVDGQLEFMKTDGKKQIHEYTKNMEPERRRAFEAIRDARWPLATFEFKSLSAGPTEVMNSVPAMDKFNWTFCADRNCHNEPGKHQLPKERVGRVSVGCDAQAPQWKLPVCFIVPELRKIFTIL